MKAAPESADRVIREVRMILFAIVLLMVAFTAFTISFDLTFQGELNSLSQNPPVTTGCLTR